MRNAIKKLLTHATVLRRLAKGRRPRIVVLVYHDLREDDDFDNWLRVSVSRFDAQLRFLGSLGEFVTPAQAEQPAQLDPERLHFLLTFDDGYVNNHRLAMPLLAKHRAPALFFVSTGPLQSQLPFWCDVIVTPIQVLGLSHLDLTATGLGEFRFRRDREARWDDIERLLVALKARGDEDHPAVASVLDRFWHEYRDVLTQHLPRLGPLEAAQAREMAANPWCYLGSHGHHHRILTRATDHDLAASLGESRRILESIAAAPVRHLAFPNGDCDGRTIAAAAAAGYERAYTMRPGILDPATEHLAIPRLGVGGTGPEWLLQYQLSRLLLNDQRSRFADETA
jgi:peptidoglycan/xylan/chitin deacetylase (PgdA/CDA1 family)